LGPHLSTMVWAAAVVNNRWSTSEGATPQQLGSVNESLRFDPDGKPTLTHDAEHDAHLSSAGQRERCGAPTKAAPLAQRFVSALELTVLGRCCASVTH
jgi:hypothetical protein